MGTPVFVDTIVHALYCFVDGTFRPIVVVSLRLYAACLFQFPVIRAVRYVRVHR